jgi:undecaprenyl diphosphate synthase
MGLLESVIDKELGELHAQGVRLLHIGRLEQLSPALQSKIRHAIELTKNNTRLTVVIAFNYGGRDEIVYAMQEMIREGIQPDSVTEEQIARHLFTRDIPAPDLIIRTSGEMRLSNFLLWQAAYSEYYITPTFWPDFDKKELQKALDEFAKRTRRFGCLEENGD